MAAIFSLTSEGVHMVEGVVGDGGTVGVFT